ncbi:hypothetical protein I79_004971 [Cricetulus griseus]|uniref:Uncharacterized protein n=1 Tax=Cricetulus griseus TaxID=10029 RepID=G3H3X9_CRIGR|nr:hypothetical protein I79_004971 [Cricetulus griseus]
MQARSCKLILGRRGSRESLESDGMVWRLKPGVLSRSNKLFDLCGTVCEIGNPEQARKLFVDNKLIAG